jgi:hypothetical protein
MTLLEIMAKEHWSFSENMAWEALRPQDREHMLGVMRRALLALAEAELPHRMEDDRGTIVYPNEMGGIYRDVFRIMLRAIAEETDA